jgi:hypothetical protein
MSHTDTIVPALLFPVFFAVIWFLATSLIAVVGGWRSLAANHRAPEGFLPSPEERHRFKSMLLRRFVIFPARYRSCITVGLTPKGLYLSPFVLFRFQHPPLLIPWEAIRECEKGSFLWNRWIDLEARSGGPTIRLYGSTGDAVATEWNRRGRGAAYL